MKEQPLVWNSTVDLTNPEDIHKGFISHRCVQIAYLTLRKKESQNGPPRRAVWLSVTQLSMEPHFGATKDDYEERKWLSSTKESRFSKLLSKRAI